jgi:hypothetical protein
VSYTSPYGSAPSPEPTGGYKSPYGSAPQADKQSTYASPYGKKIDLKEPVIPAAGKALSGAFELMNRPAEAAWAKLSGRAGYWDTMKKGSSPDQEERDRYAASDPFMRKVNEMPYVGPVAKALEDTGVNPLSALGITKGGRSLMSHATEAAERHGLPAAVEAGAHLPAPVAGAAAKVHDFMGVHSQAKRELAAEHGPQWLDEYARLRAKGMNLPYGEKIEDTQFQPALRNGKPVYGPGPAGGPPVQKGAHVPNPDADMLKTMKGTWTGSKIPGADAAGKASDFFTAGLFMSPFGHMANISGLGALADPAAVAKAIGKGTVDNAKRLVGKGETEEAFQSRMGPAKIGGAVGQHPEARDSIGFKAAEDFLSSKGGAAGKALSLVPKALGGLYRASAHTLWRFDDEVKAQRWDHLVDGGMDPFVAGTRVGGELVDYENKSPVGRMLKTTIAPFATWRTKMPLAMGRNIVENPGRAAFMSSLAPAAMGGKQGTDPANNGKPFSSSLPGSELNEILDYPKGTAKYGMGFAGVVPRLGLDAIGAVEGIGDPNKRRQKQLRTQGTYGKEPFEYLINELPVANLVLQNTKYGMFNHGRQPTLQEMVLNLIRARSK